MEHLLLDNNFYKQLQRYLWNSFHGSYNLKKNKQVKQ